jgi:hypothetical protein
MLGGVRYGGYSGDVGDLNLLHFEARKSPHPGRRVVPLRTRIRLTTRGVRRRS